ncbi:hypothetical protein BpHYR1_030813 [Brachionus plicatilis]|uniref:Uncharacterized protein n=1 Tax=Brachionus plicatilis TaxID=10195 RepID=A0A3M7PAT7_BRAPC|nr:hypothetical protein BpHYR1_030813 [Brachionus plicatilis]
MLRYQEYIASFYDKYFSAFFPAMILLMKISPSGIELNLRIFFLLNFENQIQHRYSLTIHIYISAKPRFNVAEELI